MDKHFLIGMDVDIVHEASPERDIKGQKKKASAIPVISKIWAMPGEKPKTTTSKGSKAAPSNGAPERRATGARPRPSVRRGAPAAPCAAWPRRRQA